MTTTKFSEICEVNHNGEIKAFLSGSLSLLVYKDKCRAEDAADIIKRLEIPTDGLYLITKRSSTPDEPYFLGYIYKGKLVVYGKSDSIGNLYCTEWNQDQRMSNKDVMDNIRDYVEIWDSSYRAKTIVEGEYGSEEYSYSWGLESDGAEDLILYLEDASKEDISISKINY